jgi:hypothetical protein
VEGVDVVTGLHFMLSSGQSLLILLEDVQASQLVMDWLSGAMALRDKKRIGGASLDGITWAVAVDEIVAIHTVDPSVLVAQQQRPPLASGAQFGVPTTSIMSGVLRDPVSTLAARQGSCPDVMNRPIASSTLQDIYRNPPRRNV